MVDYENFKCNIKKWSLLEKKIYNLNKSIKELKYNRDILEDNLTKYIIEHKLTNTPITFDNNKIKYNESNVAQPITYKFLIDIFSEMYDKDKANEIIKIIKTKREIKKQINLKLSEL